MKQLTANRVPPGDRWSLIGDEEGDKIIFDNLTDCLNRIFVVHNATQFFVNAKKGQIHIEDGVEEPVPIKKYSLYGDEYWFDL